MIVPPHEQHLEARKGSMYSRFNLENSKYVHDHAGSFRNETERQSMDRSSQESDDFYFASDCSVPFTSCALARLDPSMSIPTIVVIVFVFL